MGPGRWSPLVVAAVAALSGCLDGKSASPAGLVSGDAATGSVHGLVVDEEYLPVAGARVSVAAVSFAPIQLSTTSAQDGTFRIDQVPTGSKVLSAERDGYVAVEIAIKVPPGTSVEQTLTLPRLPGATPRIAPQAPLAGRFECGAEWIRGGGSCDDPLPWPLPHVFNASNNHTFDVPAAWGGLLFEVEWHIESTNHLLEGFRFEVAPANGTGLYAATNGSRSPLRIVLEPGAIHAGASLNATVSDGGEILRLRARPIGMLAGATCSVACEGGAGAGLDVKYKVWPTVFFGGRVDPAYSALPP